MKIQDLLQVNAKNKKALAYSFLSDLATRVYSFWHKEYQCYFWHLRFTDPDNPRAFSNLEKTLERTIRVLDKTYGVQMTELEVLVIMSNQTSIRVFPGHAYSKNQKLIYGLPFMGRMVKGFRVYDHSIHWSEIILRIQSNWDTPANIGNIPYGSIILTAVRYLHHPNMEMLLLQLLLSKFSNKRISEFSMFEVIIPDNKKRGTKYELQKAFPQLPWDNLASSQIGNQLERGQTVKFTIDGQTFKVTRL